MPEGNPHFEASEAGQEPADPALKHAIDQLTDLVSARMKEDHYSYVTPFERYAETESREYAQRIEEFCARLRNGFSCLEG